MTPTAPLASEPPIHRPTDLRWGCVVLFVLGALIFWASIPDFGPNPRGSGQLTAASLQAGGIYKAMVLYADDHDGKFPTAESNSNQAFRQLFPDYMETEKSFYVPGSAWHDAAAGKRPDDDIGSPPGYAKCLERGENHWAYVTGLDATSASKLPIIADGFVENQPGTYTDKQTKKGGVWKGQKAIVVFADGSVKTMSLSTKTGFRVLRTNQNTPEEVDIFTREGGLPEGTRVLNPE